MQFIIWAAARTSSTNLCLALDAENEPFQAGPPPSRLNWAYEDWRTTGSTSPIDDLCGAKISFKHVHENFDDGFNIAVAEAANRHDYLHIHLVRLDEVSRLVSLDVAGQLNAWWKHDADDRFAELRNCTRTLNPLDVPRLVEVSKHVRRSWCAIEPYATPLLRLTFEELTTRDVQVRHAAIQRLVNFLDLPNTGFARLDEAMISGGQDTSRIYDLVPNIDELRRMLLV